MVFVKYVLLLAIALTLEDYVGLLSVIIDCIPVVGWEMFLPALVLCVLWFDIQLECSLCTIL